VLAAVVDSAGLLAVVSSCLPQAVAKMVQTAMHKVAIKRGDMMKVLDFADVAIIRIGKVMSKHSSIQYEIPDFRHL
jgi:hypothetical protein